MFQSTDTRSLLIDLVHTTPYDHHNPHQQTNIPTTTSSELCKTSFPNLHNHLPPKDFSNDLHPSTSHNLRSTIAPHLSRDRTRTTTRTRKHTHKNIKERRVGQPKIRQNHWPANQPSKQPVRRLTEPCRFILWNPTAHKQQHDDTTAEIPTKQQQQQQHTIRRTQQHAHKPELSCLFPLFPFVPWLGSRTTTDNKHQASTVQDTTNPSLSYSHT